MSALLGSVPFLRLFAAAPNQSNELIDSSSSCHQLVRDLTASVRFVLSMIGMVKEIRLGNCSRKPTEFRVLHHRYTSLLGSLWDIIYRLLALLLCQHRHRNRDGGLKCRDTTAWNIQSQEAWALKGTVGGRRWINRVNFCEGLLAQLEKANIR